MTAKKTRIILISGDHEIHRDFRATGPSLFLNRSDFLPLFSFICGHLRNLRQVFANASC
jgi:hypothetical protein